MTALKSEIRDGMRIDWDVPITMDDGIVLRADVFRPVADGRYPALLSYGPYGKGLAFQDGYKTAWEIMAKQNPDALAGSTNKYQSWEVVDPEKWVPDGYVCVRVDSRGAGRSPGYLSHNNARENRDFHRLHRVGGGAALVQRQGRSQRHFLLRVAASGAPRRRSRRISRRSACGKAGWTTTATRTATAASSACSARTGRTCR